MSLQCKRLNSWLKSSWSLKKEKKPQLRVGPTSPPHSEVGGQEKGWDPTSRGWQESVPCFEDTRVNQGRLPSSSCQPAAKTSCVFKKLFCTIAAKRAWRCACDLLFLLHFCKDNRFLDVSCTVNCPVACALLLSCASRVVAVIHQNHHKPEF